MEPKDIVRALVDRGWTQAEIAKRCGSSQPTISDVLKGKHCKRGISYRLYSALLQLHASVATPGALVARPVARRGRGRAAHAKAARI